MSSLDQFLFLLIILILIITVSLAVKQYYYYGGGWVIKRSSSSTRDPPSPPGMPIIGHLHHLLITSSSVLPETLRSLANRYSFPLMRLRFGTSATALIVSDVSTAKQILKHNEFNFLSRPNLSNSTGAGQSSSSSSSSSLNFDIYDGSTFIFAEYGEYWRFMKKLCMTELLSVSQVNRFSDIRREEAMKLMENLVRCSDEGKPCNLGFLILTMTNNVICRMVMSTRCSGNVDQSKMIWDIAKEAQHLFLKAFLLNAGPLAILDHFFGYGKRLKALFNKFDSLIETIMAEHEQNHRKRKDVLDILLDILHHRGDDDENSSTIKLTRTNIKCFIMELFLAGTETTSVALQWAMAEVINSKETFKKLREEIDSVVGSSRDRLVEESDVPKISYLQAIVKETLRKHPPAPLLFRKCEKECKISGYDLLANENVVFNLRAIMRDPEHWGRNPDEFDPERFINKIKNSNSKSSYDHYQMEIKGQNNNISLIPFGSGRRGCPGASLALSVLHEVVGLLVQCFDFKLGDGETINMKEASGFSTTMAYPLTCYPVVRLNPFNLPSASSSPP